MTAPEQHLEQLGRWAYKRDHLIEMLASLSVELDAAVAAAIVAGVDVAAVADAAGLSLASTIETFVENQDGWTP